jgi:hypothetical protein
MAGRFRGCRIAVSVRQHGVGFIGVFKEELNHKQKEEVTNARRKKGSIEKF